jgi:hypothetical protein
VRDIGKVFELIDNIKKILENINSYISIYPDADAGTENIKFSEKCKMPVERAGRKAVTGIKNFARP